MRLFIATFLSDANQTRYRELASEWCLRFPLSIRAVPAGTVHVTYAFLPRVDEQRLVALASAIAEVAAAAAPFAIRLGSPGVLWAGRVPRLIEAKIGSDAGDVMRVGRAIQVSVTASAPDLEFRPAKSAHVTLARFRRGTPAAEAQRAGSLLGGETRDDEVTAVSLVESRLTPGGPVYRVVADYALARSG